VGVEVVDPDGRRPLSLTDAAQAQSFRLTQAGFYQIRLANNRQDVVGVNPDRRASSLDVVAPDVRGLWQGRGPSTETASTGSRPRPDENKTPFSLWRYVLILALLAAIFESVLASRYLGVQPSES
jgi:hypothetical protein